MKLDGSVLSIRLTVFSVCFSLAALVFVIAILCGLRKDKSEEDEDAIMVGGRSFKEKFSRWLSLSPSYLIPIFAMLILTGILGLCNYVFAFIVDFTIMYYLGVHVSLRTILFCARGDDASSYLALDVDTWDNLPCFRSPSAEALFSFLIYIFLLPSLFALFPILLTVCIYNLFGTMNAVVFGAVGFLNFFITAPPLNELND